MTGSAIGLAAGALVAVLVAIAVVLRARRTAGDRRPASARSSRLPPDLAAPAGGLVLLQFSTSFSRSCRDTRAVLADVAGDLPAVTHREIDLATRPELPARLDIAGAPTTLLVDAAGTELLRVGGVPRRRELTDAITEHLPRRTV